MNPRPLPHVAWLFALLLPTLLTAPRPAAGQDLAADLSSHLIAISASFTGARVVLFGAIEEAGDIAVVVRGPTEQMVVRRKDRISGVWMNRASMTFAGVPSFYRVASNRPLEEFAQTAALERHGIGLDYLRLEPVAAGGLIALPPDPETAAAPEPAAPPGPGEDTAVEAVTAAAQDGIAPAGEIARFRQALIRNQQRAGVYGIDPGRVLFLGERLFRTDVVFPANLPTGQYLVSVFLFRDGDLVSAQTTPLVVSKIGASAEVFAFAHRRAATYGLIAILVAVLAGWLASVIFRRS